MMTIHLHACAIAYGVDTWPTFYAQELVHHDVPPKVLLHIQALHQGRWLHAGRPNCGARRDGALIGKHYGIRRNLLGLHAVDDLHLLSGEPSLSGVDQGRIEPFEDVVPGVYEHEADTAEVHVGVVFFEHIEDEVV